ncbi:MAG TPA: imelysin family protein [Kofleriaceae bacterium]|jgi:predicted lipoprotein|nr:imelysin family protein [Kofleriaceae bacterium]
MRHAATTAALLAAVTAAACGSNTIDYGPRRAALAAIGDQVIVPGYVELARVTGELAVAARADLPALDAARLAALQDRWRAVRAAWLRTQAHRIGPVRDDLFESRIAQWPVDQLDVEALVAGTATVDRALIDTQGANRKGLAVAEYLLFSAGTGTGAADPLAALADPRRRAYLQAVLDAIADETTALAAAWTGGYAARFANPGEPDAAFATVKEGIDAVVNANVFLAENVADTKLGAPLGAMTGGIPQIELVESPWSDHGADDVAAAYDGLRAILDGPDGAPGPEGGDPFLAALLEVSHPEIADQLRADLTGARDAVVAVSHPLIDAVAAKTAAVDAAWTTARTVKATYKTEVVAALGVTLSFNDNDGD